jgi:hypothetical protein
MSTSDRVIFAEVAGAAALVLTIVALASPADPWMSGVGFHPAWTVVIVFAARYGTRGLFLGLLTVWGGLAAIGLALAGTMDGLIARASNVSDLFVLGCATLVAWIAMLHEGRIGRMSAKLAAADQARQTADETVEAMREVIGFLRARNDRIDMSITMWRDLATRIERGEPTDAAGAALELCAVRAGAASGVVYRWDGSALHTVVWRGASPGEPETAEPDRTALAAASRRRAVLASDLDEAGAADGDLAVPVVSEEGEVLGVIALRGVAPGKLRAVDARDAVIVARWLAPSLAALADDGRPASRRRSTLEGVW